MKNLSVAFLMIVALGTACWAESAPAIPATPAPPAEGGPAYHALVKEAKAHVKEFNIEQFKAFRDKQQNYTLIDVRESEEWAGGHAAGALHISKGTIEKKIEAQAPKKDAVIVLYCHSGARSALAAENLMRMGYSNVYSLDGGITAYQAAGLPMEK